QLLRVGIRPAPGQGVQHGNGRPLLVFNGIGANLELMAPLCAELDDIEALVFDVPGAGESPPPARPYRPFWIARLAARLLDHLGYRQGDGIGVSWGARVGAQ